MQNKPSDTPKIIGLIVAIIFVFGFVIWRIIGATQEPAATPATASSTGVTSGATVTPASSSSGTDAVKAVPGQIRFTNTQFDEDPPKSATGIALPPAVRASVFRTIEGPKPPPTTTIKTTVPPHPPVVDGGGRGAPTPPEPLRMNYKTELKDLTVEGVITGSDGFAMITEKGSDGKDVTLFPRVGAIVHGYRITRLGESGITVKKDGVPKIWEIGKPSQYEVLVPVSAGTSMESTLQTAPINSPLMRQGSAMPVLEAMPSANGVPANTPTQQH